MGGRAGLSHQLVIADGQVGHLAPADEDHVKAALRLPAVDTQRVLAAAVQAAAIGVEEDAPGPGERGRWVPNNPGRLRGARDRTGQKWRWERPTLIHIPVLRRRAGPTTQLPAYLTGPGSPSMQLTIWNFSRSQKRMVLQRQPGCAEKPGPSSSSRQACGWGSPLLSRYLPPTSRSGPLRAMPGARG